MSSALPTSRSKPGKFRELEMHLRKAISKGTWAPGERLPSFAELREQFEMAPSTVSRALLHLERDGLVVRRPGSGIYVAEPPKKQLKGVIGFQGFSFKERYLPYWMNLMEGVQDAAHVAGFEVLLHKDQTAVKWEKVDGVLIHGENIPDEKVPHLMPRVAVVFSGLPIPTVRADDLGGIQLAVNHLIALGHRRIGYMCFVEAEVVQSRIAGYRAALSRAGIAADPLWLRGIKLQPANSARHLGEVNMAQWLADGWKETGCTALLVQNDLFALGVLDAFKVAGIRVPEDVSLVGYDGTELGESAEPTLTSVGVPLEKIGSHAVEMLLRMVHGEHMDAITLSLPTHLVPRNSTAPPRK